MNCRNELTTNLNNRSRFKWSIVFGWIFLVAGVSWQSAFAINENDKAISEAELAKVKQFERKRIESVNKVMGSVIAIYGEERQGGGSGVIIDPSGIGLTNHHVIMGAGVNGWGGLADGELYRWKLIGTDPGGDVAIIQLEGRDDFPFSPLADSDTVRVGDWSLAMGNPFVLTEDQAPTVTLGIVSGVKRYQWGAGQNQLVYGNCIQTDSSINPGNSGGPLFNLDGQVIGINGRGSFKERGRVNVGLGYAISSNQIKNFIPDLLATKLVEHGTLDANFEDRNGKVVCSNVYEDAKLYKLGVRPGDELLEFEGIEIETAHQFTNLICTLPEDWPASLRIRKPGGKELDLATRLYGLPYAKPRKPNVPENEEDQTPEQKEQLKRMQEMIDLLSASPGEVRMKEVNRQYVSQLVGKLTADTPKTDAEKVWLITDNVVENGERIGTQQIAIAADGRFEVDFKINDVRSTIFWDGSEFRDLQTDKKLSLVDAKLNPATVQAFGVLAANGIGDLSFLGEQQLDGADKSQLRPAYRLKLTEDNDSFFFWLSQYNKEGRDDVKLLKASADWNCEPGTGGVTFHDWKTENGLSVPRRRELIEGLGEKSTRTYQNAANRFLQASLPMNKPARGEEDNEMGEEKADADLDDEAEKNDSEDKQDDS